MNTFTEFPGTASPRHLRILKALLKRPCKREEIDRIAQASNGPDEIYELRNLGLEIPCQRIPIRDRDSHRSFYGEYSLTPADCQKVIRWASREGVTL